MPYRTFGWVQNPSDFNKLKKTVQVFDNKSKHYSDLRDHIVKDVIYFQDDRESFQKELDLGVCEFSYKYLVGTNKDKSGKPAKNRKDSVANSLLQISILPQSFKTTGRNYTDNWTADGFLRWAVSLNFLSYDRDKDTFKITKLGKEYSGTKNGSVEERSILREAMLSYPPATRVMMLLSEGKPMTKFAIGSQLGFVGEKGFTSYGEETMIDMLKRAENSKEMTKIRSDIEGTSDKYARMICGWLIKLGFVSNKSSKYINEYGNEITGFQEYYLTGEGLHAIRQANGASKNTVKQKFLMWEFFATENERKGEQTRDFVRTRRAWTLKSLEHNHAFDTILSSLKRHGIEEEMETLKSDLNKFVSFGIRISVNGNKVQLKDKINDFSIPKHVFTLEQESKEHEEIKNTFRRKTNLPEKYLELLDIAFDPKRNRDFEIITTDLFRDVYKLEAVHLGGGSKPDGVVYNNNFGIILDTKAYEKGYGKDIKQIDEMIRYIEDNAERDRKRNPNMWWENFGFDIPGNNYYYLWVSGKFLPRFQEQLKMTNYRTEVNGGGLNVRQLLWGADAVQKGELDVNEIPRYMNNTVIEFV